MHIYAFHVGLKIHNIVCFYEKIEISFLLNIPLQEKHLTRLTTAYNVRCNSKDFQKCPKRAKFQTMRISVFMVPSEFPEHRQRRHRQRDFPREILQEDLRKCLLKGLLRPKRICCRLRISSR